MSWQYAIMINPFPFHIMRLRAHGKLCLLINSKKKQWKFNEQKQRKFVKVWIHGCRVSFACLVGWFLLLGFCCCLAMMSVSVDTACTCFVAPSGYPHNFCRNPGEKGDRPWCFTTDRDVRWEYCSISECSECRAHALNAFSKLWLFGYLSVCMWVILHFK